MGKEVTGLPTMATDMSLANPDIQQKYSASIDKLLSTIENRGNDINWAKVSAAMANPGRTGNWSEGFANAMGVIGQQREEQEKNALPIAQMRAQLVGKQYEMGLKSNALNMVGQTLRGAGIGAATGAGGNAMAALQSGNLFDPSFTQKLMSIYPMAAQDKDTGHIVKEMIDQGFKLQTQIVEQRKAGTAEATLYAQHGPKILPLLSPEFKKAMGLDGASTSTTQAAVNPNLTSGPARPEPLSADVVPIGEPSGKTPEQVEETRARGDTPAAPITPATAPTQATPPAREDGYTRVDGSFAPFPPNSSIQMQNALVEANEKTIQASKQASIDQGNKYWNTQKEDTYAAGSPQAISRQKNDLNIIGDAAINKPQIFGQLAKSDLFSALGAAAERGAQTPWGTFSLPVDQFVSQLKLDDPDYALKVAVAKSAARIFFDNAQVAKSVLGRFTDQDARLAQAPLVQMTDPALAVMHWVGESKLGLLHKEDVYKSLNSWEDKNQGVSARKFFAPTNSEFQRILAEYDTRLATWIKQSPLYRSK
jgi:hypothetical protein